MAVEIEVGFGRRGEAIDQCGEVGMFAGLHQAKVPLRQCESRFSRQRAEDRNIKRGDCVGNECAVPLTADAIKNDTGDADARVVRGKAAHHCRGRLCLPRDIDHQHNRQSKVRGKVGGRATPSRRRGCIGSAIEQTHDAFDDDEVCAIARLVRKRVEKFSRHGPAIDIDA